MKKFVFVTFFFLLLLFLLSNNSAYAGPQCDALGGRCRIACLSAEDPNGTQDCPSGTGPVPNQTCCVPKPIPTSVASPASIDPDTIINQLNQQLNCGKIGQACCSKIDAPLITLTPPNIFPGLDQVLGWIVGFVNSIASKVGSIVSFVTNIFTDPVSKILCTEKGSYPSDRNNISNCQCLAKSTFDIGKLCLNIKNGTEKSECIKCSTKGIWTALGCVDFKLEEFVRQTVFGLGIGLAGVVALLCIIYSAFMMQTSSGNPERIKKAQELLTSCIMGLMLIIFSVFILRLIGVDILKIPGFGK